MVREIHFTVLQHGGYLFSLRIQECPEVITEEYISSSSPEDRGKIQKLEETANNRNTSYKLTKTPATFGYWEESEWSASDSIEKHFGHLYGKQNNHQRIITTEEKQATNYTSQMADILEERRDCTDPEQDPSNYKEDKKSNKQKQWVMSARKTTSTLTESVPIGYKSDRKRQNRTETRHAWQMHRLRKTKRVRKRKRLTKMAA